jgi:hypothetical protein
MVVRGDFYTELPIIGLVGGRSFSELDWSIVEERCRELRHQSEVRDPLMRHAEGLAMMLIGPVPELPDGPLNTLANAWLEWDAGRNIIGLQTPWFVGVPEAEWVRDVQQASGQTVDPAMRAAHDAGQFFMTLEVAIKLKAPGLAALTAQIEQRLPQSLRRDLDSDWQQWPMRIKPDASAFAEQMAHLDF